MVHRTAGLFLSLSLAIFTASTAFAEIKITSLGEGFTCQGASVSRNGLGVSALRASRLAENKITQASKKIHAARERGVKPQGLLKYKRNRNDAKKLKGLIAECLSGKFAPQVDPIISLLNGTYTTGSYTGTLRNAPDFKVGGGIKISSTLDDTTFAGSITLSGTFETIWGGSDIVFSADVDGATYPLVIPVSKSPFKQATITIDRDGTLELTGLANDGGVASTLNVDARFDGRSILGSFEVVSESGLRTFEGALFAPKN